LREHIIANQQKHILFQLEALCEQNRRLATTRETEIADLKENFKKFAGKLQMEIELGTPPDTTWLALSTVVTRGKQYTAEQIVLEFLHFSTIEDRYVRITNAHRNTFDWIYERGQNADSTRPATNFVEWLESDSPVYWVSGKPGSGKSTFMKYLSTEDRTRDLLSSWSGMSELITASYFFWVAARSSLQKSQEGLLRSILWQIFRKNPDIIQSVFADQWMLLQSDDSAAKKSFLAGLSTVSTLLELLHKTCAKLGSSQVKFFFFIDGLDEYEGKPDNIIKLIDLLKISSNVKICVSSRSWNEFEDAFGRDNPWKLYMHDLTDRDIRNFVRDNLETDVRFQQLREHDERCPDFIQEIVDTSRGVFLWVFLVVRSLLEGLTNADRIVDLERRFRELPTDLDEFFKRMLLTIDEFYRPQTAYMFLVTLKAHRLLPLTTYWFMDQDDQRYVNEVKIEPLPLKKANFRASQMQKRLNALCKGLLESPWNPNDSPLANISSEYLLNQNVDFLHRTVRDFMETTYMEGFLREWAKSSLQVDLVICEAIIAQIKTAPRSIYCFQKNGLVRQFISAFFHHAKRLNDIGLKGAPEMRLLKDLDSALTTVERQMKSQGFEDIYYEALGDSSISLAATRHGFSGHPRNDTAMFQDAKQQSVPKSGNRAKIWERLKVSYKFDKALKRKG
jgi:hypothetical protein